MCLWYVDISLPPVLALRQPSQRVAVNKKPCKECSGSHPLPFALKALSNFPALGLADLIKTVVLPPPLRHAP
jgi:hypothetical protein